MSLERRVSALVRRSAPRGPCAACGGKGRHAVVLDRGGGGAGPARGCPRCGKVAGVTRIVLERRR